MRMRKRDRDDESGGLWIPGAVESGQSDPSWAGGTVGGLDDLGYQPSVEQHHETHWVLKYPPELGGLFVKASAINRPVSYDPGDGRMTYSLHVHRFTPYGELTEGTGPLSREELVALGGLIDTVIRASVS